MMRCLLCTNHECFIRSAVALGSAIAAERSYFQALVCHEKNGALDPMWLGTSQAQSSNARVSERGVSGFVELKNFDCDAAPSSSCRAASPRVQWIFQDCCVNAALARTRGLGPRVQRDSDPNLEMIVDASGAGLRTRERCATPARLHVQCGCRCYESLPRRIAFWLGRVSRQKSHGFGDSLAGAASVDARSCVRRRGWHAGRVLSVADCLTFVGALTGDMQSDYWQFDR